MIYFIKSGNFLKVGFSADVPKRMKQYATHNPDFKLLFIIAGDIKLERQIQSDLDRYRFRLEWFHCDEHVLAHVEYLRVKYKDWVEDLESIKLKMRDIEYELLTLIINTAKEVTNFPATKHFKLEWAKALKVPIASIESTLTKLIKKKVLTKVTTGILCLDSTKLDRDLLLTTNL